MIVYNYFKIYSIEYRILVWLDIQKLIKKLEKMVMKLFEEIWKYVIV